MEQLENLWPKIYGGKNVGTLDFEQIRKFILALMADLNLSLQGTDGYGLIYSESIPFELKVLGNRLQLFNMLGTTPNGMFITQKEKYSAPLFEELPLKSSFLKQNIYVAVTQSQTEWNNPKQMDSYERSNSCVPKYELELTEWKQETPRDFENKLKIGELEFQNNKYQLNEFIPPCRDLGAHREVWGQFLIFKSQWDRFVAVIPYVIANTLESATYSEKSDLYRMADAIVRYFGDNNAKFVALQERSSPKELFQLVAGLAFVFFNQLKIAEILQRKAGLLNLFREVTYSAPAYRFEQQSFVDAITLLGDKSNDLYKGYTHHDLHQVLQLMNSFFTQTTQVWERLKEPLPSNGLEREAILD